MSRGQPERVHAVPPRIALNLGDAAAAAGVEPELLKGQIFHGYLHAKRTSTPDYLTSYGNAWGGGRYLIGVEDLACWLRECGEAADAGLSLGWTETRSGAQHQRESGSRAVDRLASADAVAVDMRSSEA